MLKKRNVPLYELLGGKRLFFLILMAIRGAYLLIGVAVSIVIMIWFSLSWGVVVLLLEIIALLYEQIKVEKKSHLNSIIILMRGVAIVFKDENARYPTWDELVERIGKILPEHPYPGKRRDEKWLYCEKTGQIESDS